MQTDKAVRTTILYVQVNTHPSRLNLAVQLVGHLQCISTSLDMSGSVSPLGVFIWMNPVESIIMVQSVRSLYS